MAPRTLRAARRRPAGWLLLGAAALFASAACNSSDPSHVTLERRFPGLQFTLPVGMFQAPGNNGAWYLLERAGRVLAFPDEDSADEPSTVLDIRTDVDTEGEGGLLGLAFHPDFDVSGAEGQNQVFIYYTRDGTTGPLRTVVARFTYSPGTDTLDPASEASVFELEQPAATHNGGMIAFGHDGHLYIGLGDGGGPDDPDNNGQNINTHLGKMLRIDVDGGSPYAIPSGNPFVGTTGKDAIYAWGFRNPWRWSFDSAAGNLWLGDVGQKAREEVNRVELGRNYGWDTMEGSTCHQSSQCDTEGLTLPVAEYSHQQGCAITGGYVYRGASIGSLRGHYLYADFCSGRIWSLEVPSGAPRLLMETELRISSFAQANDGEVFALNYDGGTVWQFVED